MDDQYNSMNPMQLQYVGPRLRGQSTTFVQWIIYPNSSAQMFATDAQINIQSNITQGLVDWYRSHIQIVVQVPIADCPVGGMQIDSSAFGCISSLILYHYNFQVQRIMNLDVLMAYLVDLGFSQWVCQSRVGQGLGYSNLQYQAPMSVNKGQLTVQRLGTHNYSTTSSNLDQAILIAPGGGYSPTLTSITPGGVVGSYVTVGGLTNTVLSSIHRMGVSQSHQTLTNSFMYPYLQNGTTLRQAQKIIDYMGRAGNLRAQYKYNISKNDYPDTVDSYPLLAPKVKNQNWTYSTAGTTGYDKQRPYQIQFPQSSYQSYGQPNFNVGTCGVSGYNKPLAPQFCRGAFEPFLSPTIPQCQMSYGVITNTPFPVSKRRYRFPLPSSICGVLIPPDQFKLLPCQAYQNLTLQLMMNPYWMFSTGYSDVHQFDSTGMSYPIKRNWRYNQINWTWHVYTMNNQMNMRNVQAKLYKGIQFSSKSWLHLCLNNLTSGSAVKQTTLIPCNVQSLAQIVVLFLSNQYQIYPFCRKNFRLSNNITSMQIRANTIYYPSQPIQGCAGNCQMVDQSGDNWPFYQQILLSNNFLFSTNAPVPRINPKNFAINARSYDVTNKNTLYSKTKMYFPNVGAPGNALNDINITNINADTAMGQSFFHQNAYVGRAAFTYSFQPYGHSKSMVNGVNTLGWKNFQITFNASPINPFPYDQTQYVFAQCNIIIKLNAGRPMQILGI